MQYRREIDGLRAVAVFAVIAFHAGIPGFKGGFAGVDIFFVISGYLITSLLEVEKKSSSFSIAHFYARRARRILPALFFVAACCLPFAWWLMLASEMKDFSESLISVATFSSNILFWRQSGYFETTSELKPLLHTWSLAIEEQFYLIFPILLWAISQGSAGFRKAVLLCLASVSLLFAIWSSKTHPAFAFFLLPSRSWELLLGALLAIHGPARMPTIKPWLCETGSSIGIVLITYTIYSFDAASSFPGTLALIPTAGTGLVISYAVPSTFVGRLLGSRLLVGVGLLSYSLYLWHQPIFAFSRMLGTNVSSSHSQLFVLILVVTVFSFLSWRFIEIPFRRSLGIGRVNIAKASALGILSIVGAGTIGIASNGFLGRFAPEDKQMAQLGFNTGKYTAQRFFEHFERQFDNSQKRKIALIGDSYGEDLVNALYEAGEVKDLQLSTFHINKDCGNLYLPVDSFKSNIKHELLQACENSGWFDDIRLRKILADADEIWLASAWQMWQAPFIPQSVKNLQNTYTAQVRVFGTKSFGAYTIRQLMAVPPKERSSFEVNIDTETNNINSVMKATINPDSFIDVQTLLCGNVAGRCRVFNGEGDLISYDGGHLTAEGAKAYGEALYADKLLKLER